MGLLDGIRRRKAEREHAVDMDIWREEHAEWESAGDRINEYVAIVQDCVNGKTSEQFTDRSGYGFLLDPDEFPVAYIAGTALLQVVRGPGRYEGGYGGVSFPVFGRVRGHVGGQRGQYIQGSESQRVTDSGETMITNERVMFRGDVRTEEWKFSKMMAMEHSEDGITTFSMSSKSKPSAIGYGLDAAPEIQFRLEIGAALARGTLAGLLSQLQAEKQHHAESEPQEPTAPAASAG